MLSGLTIWELSCTTVSSRRFSGFKNRTQLDRFLHGKTCATHTFGVKWTKVPPKQWQDDQSNYRNSPSQGLGWFMFLTEYYLGIGQNSPFYYSSRHHNMWKMCVLKEKIKVNRYPQGLFFWRPTP